MDLARDGGQRGAELDAEPAALAPLERRDALGAGARAEGGQEGFADLVRNSSWNQSWMARGAASGTYSGSGSGAPIQRLTSGTSQLTRARADQPRARGGVLSNQWQGA
jgi:hypothetical protein